MTVSFERDGKVAVLTLDDGKANALSLDVLRDIDQGLSRALDENATAVLVAGRPGRFSAGFDLSVMTSGEQPMRELVTAGAELCIRLFIHPMPVVCACTGHALAAGALVLLSGDVRIGARGEFRIGLNEVAIGLGLPAFAVELARYRLTARAFNASLLGEVFAPDDAVDAGFLDQVVAPDEVVELALVEARRLAELRTGAVEFSKDRARGALARHMAQTLDADLRDLAPPRPR